MARNRRLPSTEVLRTLIAEGKSNTEIGQKYGVTAEAVRLMCKREGIEREPTRTDHSRYLPWRVQSNHTGDSLAKNLRRYSKDAQGEQLRPEDAEKLEIFKRFMDGDNDLGVPLSVNYSRKDGFWVQRSVAGDRDYIHPPAESRR